MTGIQASMKKNEKMVFNNLQNRRSEHKLQIRLKKRIRTAAIKKFFLKGDSTNYSYDTYRITEVTHGTIPSYGINYLPERYSENLIRSTKLTLDENNQVIKEQNLVHKEKI